MLMLGLSMLPACAGVILPRPCLISLSPYAPRMRGGDPVQKEMKKK